MASNAQITHSNSFAISLQYLKKEVSDDTMVFDGSGQAFQKFQNSKFEMSLQNLKREPRDEDDFLLEDQQQSFLQVGLMLWVSKFATGGTVTTDGHDQAFSKY